MKIDYPRLLVAALAVTTVVALLIAGGTSSAAFGAYNPAWDGAADLRDVAEKGGANSSVVLNTNAYPTQSVSGTVAVVLSPETGYSERERARLRRFVENGGTLVVAEDFGPHGNALLDGVGATARFNGNLLRDERNNHRSPELPVAENVSNHSLTAGVDQLTLNHGTAVTATNATVLVRSSEFAYLDRNRNGEPDDNETLTATPVATVEPVGEGRVVAVGDPSLFINAMQDRKGNRVFAENLLSADRVLLDYSHAGPQPPLALALLRIRGSPIIQGLVTIAGLGVVFGGQRLFGQRRETSEPRQSHTSPDAIAAYLARQRPEWDRGRLRRLSAGLLAGRNQDSDDE